MNRSFFISLRIGSSFFAKSTYLWILLLFSLFYAIITVSNSDRFPPLHFMVCSGKLKGGIDPLRLAVRQCGDLS